MRGIARHTRTKWGEAQTAAYAALLRDQIKSIPEYPMRFPEFGGKYVGLRQMDCGRHMVFYLDTDDAIEIMRVLHEAMDYSEWL